MPAASAASTIWRPASAAISRTDIPFENQQNYRGTNTDLDIAALTAVRGATAASGLDATLNPALFNLSAVTRADDGTEIPLQDLVFSGALDPNVSPIAVDPAGQNNPGLATPSGFAVESLPAAARGDADNQLFASRGNDVLEGRGGDDWLEGREGNDIFIQSTFDGAPIGDGVDIVARRLDENGDGILDTDDAGRPVLGQDFRRICPTVR